MSDNPNKDVQYNSKQSYNIPISQNINKESPNNYSDNSNINIINNKKSIFGVKAMSNNSPPPLPASSVFNGNNNNKPLNQNEIHLKINANQENQNNDNYNYFNNNTHAEYNNIYNINHNYQYNENHLNGQQINHNCIPISNQTPIVKPVIVDPYYNQPHYDVEREKNYRDRTIFDIIFFYLSWCFTHIIFFCCCLIINQFLRKGSK